MVSSVIDRRFSHHSGVTKLLKEFGLNNIEYCHFKSNVHIAKGMVGETDLDILVAREQHADIVAALNLSGFKLFSSGAITRYSAVEDWLGFDPGTGRLAHLHLHWQMIVGEPNLKGYRLPWERQILNDRTWNPEYRIFITSPEMELLLLLARAVLKFRTRSLIAGWLGLPGHGAGLLREFAWLLQRVDLTRFKQLVCSILPTDISVLMLTVVGEGKLDSRKFIVLSEALLHHLAPWRTYLPAHAKLLRLQREFNSRFLQRVWRLFGVISVARRSPVTGGMIVAIIGADGAGKSTQVNLLVKWLSWKVDVMCVYFGSGDGATSWHRWFLRSILSTLRRCRTFLGSMTASSKPTSEIQVDRRSASKRPRYLMVLYAISLALEKRGVLRKAVRARNRGMVVICDRFPQNQVNGYNDGPLLANYTEYGFLWGVASRLEQHLLSVFSTVSPDFLFKLNVSGAVAKKRKSATPKAMVQKKIDAVRILSYGLSCEVIELDADLPLEEITVMIKRQIWQRL